MTYVVAEPCLSTIDRACVEVCPVQCFYEGGDQLIIHPSECVDCDACRPVCPVSAIFVESEVPPEWHAFIAKNANFVKNTPNLVRAKTKSEVEEAHLDTFAVCREAVASAAAPAAAAAVVEAPPPAPAAIQAKVVAPAPRPAAAPAKAEVTAAKVEAPAPSPAFRGVEAKPACPTELPSDLYRRGLELLREVVALQEAGRLTGERARQAETMAKDIRAELSTAIGKDKYTLADLEKKSITFRQGEELARSILRAIEGTEFEIAFRAGRQKLLEYMGGIAVLGAITAFIGWMTVRIVTAKPLSLGLPLTPSILKTAILDPETLPLFAAFSALGGILSLFCLGAIIPLWRTAQSLMAVWRTREQKRLGMRVAEAEF